MTDQDQPRSGSRWEPADQPADGPTDGPGDQPVAPVYADAPLTVPAPPSRWERVREGARRPGVLVGAGVLGLALVAGGGGFALGQVGSGHDDAPVSGYPGYPGFDGDRDGDGLRHAPPGLPPAGQVGVPGQGDDDFSGEPDDDADDDAAGSGDRT
jgi:hypothetical protein